MSKPGKQPRPRAPASERIPFWRGVARNKRARRITDTNQLPKGSKSV
jgi:hypothetical protein